MPIKIETAKMKREYWRKMLEGGKEAPPVHPPSSDSEDDWNLKYICT